jgi:hypothetical protein
MAAEIGTHRTILGVDEAVSSEVKNSAAQAGRVRRLVDPARDGVGVIGRVGAAPRLARDDKAMPEAEKLLKQLQGRIRAKPKGDSLHLNDSDVSIAAKTRKSLEDDMRYEHVDNLAVALDDFILRCHQDRSTDQGFQFERMHAKAPDEQPGNPEVPTAGVIRLRAHDRSGGGDRDAGHRSRSDGRTCKGSRATLLASPESHPQGLAGNQRQAVAVPSGPCVQIR